MCKPIHQLRGRLGHLSHLPFRPTLHESIICLAFAFRVTRRDFNVVWWMCEPGIRTGRRHILKITAPPPSLNSALMAKVEEQLPVLFSWPEKGHRSNTKSGSLSQPPLNSNMTRTRGYILSSLFHYFTAVVNAYAPGPYLLQQLHHLCQPSVLFSR
ncbi:hypothetical protein BDR04DRAFT_744550 [Suillus decipiens]|nr:hypothetical protein BDR04DRAFT_744550 [Suillus decipiens]